MNYCQILEALSFCRIGERTTERVQKVTLSLSSAPGRKNNDKSAYNNLANAALASLRGPQSAEQLVVAVDNNR